MFILQQQNGRIDLLTARDLDTLLAEILPQFFASHLLPPATAAFAVASDEATCWAIYRTIEQLRTAGSSVGSRQ